MALTGFSKRAKAFIVTDMDGTRDFPARAETARRLTAALRIAVRAAIVILVLNVAGFLIFCTLIVEEPGDIGRADAIVALTGGEARIPEAIKLLANSRGRRLLISGVNPSTTKQELADLTPDSRMWFHCCIDVGRMAQNTIGNAEETRDWVQKRRFKSLIIVTAAYHMPRSLAELRRALPDVELVAYPVKPRGLHIHTWWVHPGTLQLLASEYIKFIPALGRCTISQFHHGRGIFGGTRRCLNGGYMG